ncbi:hypothetical protein HNR67_004656 [Crossiella cryophila]|uniref:Condensation domain-containing protein n=1 Tax=Crossiella cryophila TaxID=43355 RepID=A0A7W7CCE4_9PSEU|nr:hypothetical protein [Crossiella cryophila]
MLRTVSTPPPASFPLSAAQAGEWFCQQRQPDNPGFCVAQYVDITGPVDVELLRAAVDRVLRATDSLMVRFTMDGGRVLQVVDPSLVGPMPVVDLRTAAEPEAAAHRWLAAALARPYDLLTGPVCSFALLRLAEQRTWLYLRAHHIVVDGFAGAVVVRLVAESYRAALTGADWQPGEQGSLTRMLAEEAAYRASPRYALDRAHHLAMGRATPEPVSPAGPPTPAAATFRRVTGVVPVARAARLRSLARQCRAGLPALLMAAMGVHLGRITGERAAVISVPLAARTGAVGRDTVTMMANELPLTVRTVPGGTLVELLRETAANGRILVRHQRFRWDELQRALPGRRFDAPHLNIMAFTPTAGFGAATATVHNLSNGAVEDYSVLVYDNAVDGSLQVHVNANPDRYSPRATGDLRTGFLGVLTAIAGAAPETVVDELDLPTMRTRLPVRTPGVASEPRPGHPGCAQALPGASALLTLDPDRPATE